MNEKWLFASGTRVEDWFEGERMRVAPGTEATRAIRQKVAEIQQSPVTPKPIMYGDEPVHMAKTSRFPIASGGTTPRYVLLYSLDHARRLITLLHIVKEDEVDLGPEGGGGDLPPIDDGGEDLSGHPRRPEHRDSPSEPIERLLRRVAAQTGRIKLH
jgi:hypothetical protein